MAEFMVNPSSLKAQEDDLNEICNRLKCLDRELNNAKSKLSQCMQISSYAAIGARITKTSNSIQTQRKSVSSMKNVLNQARECYVYTEKEIRGLYRGNPFENIWTDIWNEYGWNGLLAGAEYIKTLYELVSGMQKAESNADIRKNLKDWYDFITDAAKSYKNYKTIGRAVGAQKAITWWVKKITGLKPLERLSTAEKPVTRFVHNLTNKTSPFNAQFKSVIGDFKGTNGIGKAVVSWGAVVVDGIVNWFDNKDEQAKSGGKMTDQRVLNETIMETVVGTVLNYGAGIVVGAAVGAVLPVTTPGIVTLAVGGLVIASANAIVKNVTKGETITELISDSILNIYEYRADFVEKAVKTTNSWFVRMSLI